uniref:Kunitz/Bovine pancreatic trypsin inhibitor domain protein n=1 Tax=Syphacia muris TaxID=451379 RepID=A0A0N5B0E0_9BILA
LSSIVIEDNTTYILCAKKKWSKRTCQKRNGITLRFNGTDCVDPVQFPLHAQATSGSGRVGDVCSFNTDCLSGMYCSSGICRCLSTYVAVDNYCYEKINPGQSGCFYDDQCFAVWPDAYCKGGTCFCPADYMSAVKTRDGVVCVSVISGEPSCPLPNIPGPNSPSSIVVLPAPLGALGITVAACNPQSSTPPKTENDLVNRSTEFSCATKGIDGDPYDVSDIYDCIDNSHFWQSMGVNVQSHPVGVCCMNRAFTCSQPRRGESEAVGSVPRWWYNSVSGACQQFLFDLTSMEVSPNNFETLEHCEAYCKDACPRGSPAYTKGNIADQFPVSGCSAATPCEDGFECMDISSNHYCCPTRKSICSGLGGRPKDALRTTIYDSGFRFDQLTGETSDLSLGVSTRYYYNPSDGQCHPFTYNGFLGNFNNFGTLSDCQVFCSRLQCAHGNPLVTGVGIPQRCQRDSECPITHQCSPEHNVCCPTPLTDPLNNETLCTQPMRIGDCKLSIRQYWYDANTRQCTAFLFTGCQGNDNRFDTLYDCRNFCKNINAEPKCPQGRAYTDNSGKFYQCSESSLCPVNYECYFDGQVHGCCPSKAYTCSLQPNKGMTCGSGSSYRYYFDHTIKECQAFLFLGCDGNSNNFPTAEKCESYCGVGGCPNGGTPLRVKNQLQSCSDIDSCPPNFECSLITISGRPQRRCCPTRASICSRPPQMGIHNDKCSNSFASTRFYFNIALKACTEYTSNSCDLSLNSFSSKSHCENFCHASSCRAGDIAYVDVNSKKPLLCNPALQNSCPKNYECRLNTLTGDHVCCGAENMGVCPSGEKAFIDPKEMSPKECTANTEGSCPSNYVCRFSMHRHRYYCCASSTGSFCPKGKALFVYPVTHAPIECSIGSFSSCPPSYSCQSHTTEAIQGHCCSTLAICPDDVDFAVDPTTRLPIACNNDPFAPCPTGYSCMMQPSTKKMYCCSGRNPIKIAPVDGCPPNEYVYIENNKVRICDPFNLANAPCPKDYTCQWSMKNQRYQCCGAIPITEADLFYFFYCCLEDGCPEKQTAFLDKFGKPRVCTAAEESSCPHGYFCQFSTKNVQFQCCGLAGGMCPEGRLAFVSSSGTPERCEPGRNVCSSGFDCIINVEQDFICCSNETATEGCEDDEVLVNGQCLERVLPLGTCEYSEQCRGGTVCENTLCTCPEGTVLLNLSCVPDCTENQVGIAFGEVCLDKAEVGQQCISSLQCLGRSKCVSGTCECARGEVLVNGECSEVLAQCPKKDERPYWDVENTEPRVCIKTDPDSCPENFTCQYSSSIDQNICCGKADKFKKIKRGTYFFLNICISMMLLTIVIKNIKYCLKMTKKCLLKFSGNSCPKGGIPYLINGVPKKCAKALCPSGYKCVLSEASGEYICCSSKKRSGSCPRGSALIFPSTGQPVQCHPTKKKCPSGFSCLKTPGTLFYQCCTNDANYGRRWSDNCDCIEACNYHLVPDYFIVLILNVIIVTIVTITFS